MPPKSAAELALQQKYEALRKKKQEAARKKQEAPSESKPAEDPARAAAIKALKAQKAAREQPSTAAAAEDGNAPVTGKSAAGSHSPLGIKLKFVIPKKDSEPAGGGAQTSRAAPRGAPPAAPSGKISQRAKHAAPAIKRQSTAPGGEEPADGAGPLQAPTAVAAAAAPADTGQATKELPRASHPPLKPPSSSPAGPNAKSGPDAAAPKRASSAASRRLPSRRPAPPPSQQQSQEGGQEGGEPAQGPPAGFSDSPYPMAGVTAGYGGYPPEGNGEDGYQEEGGYTEEHEEGGYGVEAYEGGAGGYGGDGYEGGGAYYEGGEYGEDGYGGEEPYAKRRRGEEGRSDGMGQERDSSTLFVGDLPPYWASRDLEDFFTQFGPVRSARVMGSQCYGFVTLHTQQEAEALLESAAQQPLVVEGHGPLRVNWSQGSMPEWKKGPAIVRPRQAGEGPHGLESYEHPRVREARLAAQAVINQQELAAVNMAGPPPSREVVAYDDL